MTKPRSAGNPETVTDVAFRLGALLDQLGKEAEAHQVFTQALEVAPESPMLLRSALSQLGEDPDLNEKASLMERLLRVEEQDAAAGLSLQLANLRAELEDQAGQQRALELGLEVCPESDELRDRLETLYNDSGQFAQLAQMKIAQAETLEDLEEKVGKLREASALYRDFLSDLDTSAAILRRTQEILPGHPDATSDLAGVLASSGQFEEAITIIGSALESMKFENSLPVRMMRSSLYRGMGELTAAIEDLEAVLELDREQVEPQLLGALESCTALGASQ